MTTPPTVPQSPEDPQDTGGEFLRLHSLLYLFLRWFSRWFYLIIFGCIGLGILESVVQGFVEECLVDGKWAIPPIERFYIFQFALHSPLDFVLITSFCLGLGGVGLVNHKRFIRAEKAREEERFRDMASTTTSQVLEDRVPTIARNAVKKDVKKKVKEILKDHDNTPNESNVDITSWKSPMDIAVLPLPPAASGLVGRKEDQQWLENCLLSDKVVGVSGMGGIGKTTLVADTIIKIAPQFHSGGVAVILANDVTNSTVILRQLVEKFVPNQEELLKRPDTKVSILREALSHTLIMQREKGKRVLIVIDGAEPGLIKDEGLERLCDIFRSARVSVVITARERLSVQLVQTSRELEVFSNEAAVSLLTLLLEGFLQRSLSYSERQDVADICEIAGNHAQAIVLIAGYLEYHPQTSIASYLQRLKDSPQIVLELTNRLKPTEASRGVRLTFASSYSQLEEHAQQLFVALGALAGRGCTCQAVQALGAALNQSEDETQASLESLIRSKLVLNPPACSARPVERIELHPLVLEFAHELLRTSHDLSEDTLYETLAIHYAEWVQKTDENLLSDDDGNLIAALRWAKAHLPQADMILAKLVYDLRWYWQSQFQIEEAFAWLNAGCDVMERLGAEWDEQRGELLFAMGAQYQWIGQVCEAELCYRKSHTIFRRTKSGSKIGEALSGLAALDQQRGEPEKAQAQYEKSLGIFRKAHDQRGEADALYRLGFLALRTGNPDAAISYYTESLAVRLALGNDEWGEAVIRYSLGKVYQQMGEIGNARSFYEHSLALCKKINYRRGESLVLKALGDLSLQTSGPADARKYLTESSNISREIFDLQSQSVELYSMGFLLRQTGRTDEAWNYYNKSLEIRERLKDERGRGFTLKGLGDLARRLGDMTTAKKYLEEALTVSRRIKDRRNEGVALKALGDWAWQAGDMSAARDYYETSLPVRWDCHDLRGEAITLKALGDLALRGGNKSLAQNYLKQSLDLFVQLKDLRGQGVTLHSLGVLDLEQNEKAAARQHFDQSLVLLQRVQDLQAQSSVLSSWAVLAELQGDFSLAEKYHRDSLRIASEVKIAYNLAISQEALGEFLLGQRGQRGKEEGNLLLVKAADTYRRLGRHDDAEHTEERRVGRSKVRDRDRIVRALIFDLDEGPNGQSFTVPNERRTAHPRGI